MSTLKELAKQYGETVKTIAELEKRKDELRDEIVKTTGEYQSFKNLFLSIAYTAPSSVRTPDVDKMKAAGVYDFYTKESSRKGSYRITVKLDKIDEPDTIEVRKSEPPKSIEAGDFVPLKFGEEDDNEIPD